MSTQRITGEEVSRRGEEWYAGLRTVVETKENIGKIISIDVETGDYYIGQGVLDSGKAMLAKNPNAVLFGIRIGYDSVYSIGGARKRTEPL